MIPAHCSWSAMMTGSQWSGISKLFGFKHLTQWGHVLSIFCRRSVNCWENWFPTVRAWRGAEREVTPQTLNPLLMQWSLVAGEVGTTPILINSPRSLPKSLPEDCRSSVASLGTSSLGCLEALCRDHCLPSPWDSSCSSFFRTNRLNTAAVLHYSNWCKAAQKIFFLKLSNPKMSSTPTFKILGRTTAGYTLAGFFSFTWIELWTLLTIRENKAPSVVLMKPSGPFSALAFDSDHVWISLSALIEK